VLGQSITVEDYLRHSYAIRLWEPYAKTYSYLPIFDRGMQYPCQSGEPLTLQVARGGQTEIRLDIGEMADRAEAEVSFDAQGRMTSSHLSHRDTFRSLNNQQRDVCVAHLNPPGEMGIDRIEVLFEVDEQRVLLATVKDLLTGTVLVDRGAIVKLPN